MTDYALERATEAHWRTIIARSEGRPGIAGAWASAAEAWLRGQAALADSLEREAGRMQFAAEVRWHMAVARSSLEKEGRKTDLEKETDEDFTARFIHVGRVLDVIEVWKSVAEWADDNPAATDAWADTLVFVDDGLLYAERRWQGVHSSSDFTEVLTKWIRSARARTDATVNFEKSRDDLNDQANDADRQQLYRCIAWEKASAFWRRANEARTIGNIEEAVALEHIAGSWEHAAASLAVEKVWFVLNQFTEARDAGRAEVALAWERAAQAWREGKDNVAEAWERAAFELEEALAEENSAERRDSE